MVEYCRVSAHIDSVWCVNQKLAFTLCAVSIQVPSAEIRLDDFSRGLVLRYDLPAGRTINDKRLI